MKATLRIGFIPLLDSAPLVVALEKGFFARYGLDVELCKVQSWDRILDHLASGKFEAAHMLLTQPLQWALTEAGRTQPIVYAVALSGHGNAVTLSNALWRAGVSDALTLKTFLSGRAESNPLKLAVVHPHSTHEYLLRRWLRRGGLEVGGDISLHYVSPAEMVHELRNGGIDGFCVGEPWNQRAVGAKLGYIVATSCDVLPPMNEKVLGVRAEWHQKHADLHGGLLQAVKDASLWLGDPDHLESVADMMAGKHYVNSSRAPIRAALFGEIQAGGGRLLKPEGFLRFHGDNVNFPDPDHARFYLEEMWRCGHLDASEAHRVDLDAICLHTFYQAYG